MIIQLLIKCKYITFTNNKEFFFKNNKIKIIAKKDK